MKMLYYIITMTQILLLWGCNKGQEKYLPELRDGDFWVFSKEQLAHMEATPLDLERFNRYIETKWPIPRIQRYCVPKNLWGGRQNLVCWNNIHEADVHKNVTHEFDRIYVYVNEDNGDEDFSRYYKTAGKTWRRWTYSLNICKSNDHWCVIDSLPNDFMDIE